MLDSQPTPPEGHIVAVSTTEPEPSGSGEVEALGRTARHAGDSDRAFADALPLQVWTARPDGSLNWVNEQVIRYFGRSSERIIGEGWQDFIHPDDLPRVVERWTQSLKTAEPYEVLFRLRSAGEEYRVHIGRALPALDDAGQVREWYGSNTDIEERFRAEEALHESQGRFAFLAAVSRDLASSLEYEDTLGKIARLAVPDLADWCAVDLRDEQGALRRIALEHVDPARVAFVQRMEERYPPDPQQPYGVRHVMRTGASEFAQDIPAELLESTAVDAEHLAMMRELGLRSYVIAPIPGLRGVRGAITFVYAESGRIYEQRDVEFVEEVARRAGVAIENADLVRHLEDTRAQLEEQATELERANRVKSEFLAAMSHELRTPLNAIGGHVELIALGIHGEVTDAQRASLERIRASQEHLLGLISDILQFARVEAGRLEYRPKDFDIDELIAGVIGMLEPQMRKRELTCEHVRGARPPIARADPDRVQQILINLLGNALKFTDAGGRITLWSEIGPETVSVRVRDTGRGIPADRLGSIFDPFVQVRESRAENPAGLGLGLSISRDLARGMDGDLTAESAPRRGSTFTLRLPRAR